MTATIAPSIEFPRELDHRAGDGVEVWLLWTESTSRLFVLVVDSKLEDSFELDVDAADALDAFRHPYAYAAFRRVTYRTAVAGRATTVAG
jgi:hypothetical protein